MEKRRKQIVRTERPKVRRVYVSLINPDEPKEREYFTLYDSTVEQLARKLTSKTEKQLVTS